MDFKIGDKVFHKSNTTIIWVIERIESNEAFCSTLLKESNEQKKEKFALTSIEKYEEPQIIVGTFKRRDNYY